MDKAARRTVKVGKGHHFDSREETEKRNQMTLRNVSTKLQILKKIVSLIHEGNYPQKIMIKFIRQD